MNEQWFADDSSDDKQLYQNNKRKHEIKEIWKKIFTLISHHKCAYFVFENLNFSMNSNRFNMGKILIMGKVKPVQ